MRVLIIAGEASGDMHGAGVVRELKHLNPSIDLFGVGGDKMQSAGMELIYHVRELSVMGFLEVVQHLPVIRSVERTLRALLSARRPDLVLLIDYPGFNLRFAASAHQAGVPVYYYISPQVWAWHPGRVKKIKKVVDRMFVVFPFEEKLYRDAGIPVEFVGHPLLEQMATPQPKEDFCRRWGFAPDRPIVGLFPGSRKQELERIFPAMLGAAEILTRSHGAQIGIGAASALASDFVASFLDNGTPGKMLHNATHDLMANADVALVTSGTATLETAILQTPMVVVYRTSWLTYLLGRMLVRIDNIGLVNIVAGKQLVPEFIQHHATPSRLASSAARYLDDSMLAATVRKSLGVVKNRLGSPGASRRVAEAIVALG